MKTFFKVIATLLILSGCASHPSEQPVAQRIENEIGKGDSLMEMAGRIAIDYNLTLQEFTERYTKLAGSPLSSEDLEKWREKGWIESRIIEGDTMYFNRAASNLILLRRFHEDKEAWNRKRESDPENIFYKNHITEIISDSASGLSTRKPVRMKISYTITVESNVVPEGETVRCWLPWPRSEQPRQKEAELLSASQDDYIKSPDSAVHSTFYMERPSVKDKPTVFSISYTYESSALHFRQGSFGTEPYDTGTSLYRTYTSEQLPQIHFSPEITAMAGEIAGDETSPSGIVRKTYLWFKENVPWTGAPEYSIMEDIPGYTCSKLTGDCGMQTLLFMSLLRSRGIPVRWQSGWMVAPDAENLHDWCEVYFEDAGWIPVDISFNMPISENRQIREFYLSGIDSYRMIINRGIAGKLYPGKKYMRSEPYDFQRGEVEWKGGNLYFDKWDYDIKIEYLK